MATASRPGAGARLLAAGVAASLLGGALGCTMTRIYRGSPLRAAPAEALVAGETTKAEVLRRLGPPDGLARQIGGDVFVYRYERTNTDTLRIEEPVFTGLRLFSYTRSVEKHDSLVVLFGPDGLLREYGYDAGTEELRDF